MDHMEENAVLDVLKSGWLVQGPHVKEFEEKFSLFTGAKHAIATSSCTTALHLALLTAGVGPGDEVLLPSFTFIATANAIEYTGARPVFIDIDLSTFTISPAGIRDYLEKHMSGEKHINRYIMPVSLFGLCPDMESINTIASDYKLQVIEDAACGMGAKRENHHAGTEALAGCFSFHPRKAVTTGEGGMIITDNDSLAEKARMMRDHGASKTDLERHMNEGGSLLPAFDVLGYNYRMTDLQGALGIAQMSKAHRILNDRMDSAARYDSLLPELNMIQPPFVPRGYTHAYQSYVCLYKGNISISEIDGDINWPDIEISNQQRNRIMAGLEKSGISVRQGTHAVHTLGYYKDKYSLSDHDYPNSYIADRLSITLPLFSGITEEEQQRVVNSLKDGININM